MKITMLGTGNAGVTEYFNTCFTVSNEGRVLLVDTGGGNGLLRQLKKAGIPLGSIKDIFITHRHTDHILGAVWVFRMLSKSARWEKDFEKVNVYGNADVMRLLLVLKDAFFSVKEIIGIDAGINFIEVKDGDEREIIGRTVRFFDIHSTKADQFGFRMSLPCGGNLICFGDEPFNETCAGQMEDIRWMMHEAFCLESMSEEFRPHLKSHSSVKDACDTAVRFNVPNLIIYHTEEFTIGRRKELYSKEGSQYYGGNLLVPDELEAIEI